ncbi:DEAD/DEAH box helicase [bacterium]|nr:DEAD/DEAH box helicase [bacterium]MCB2178967.1 DEAD/DEAH box helicase [bacterium]
MCQYALGVLVTSTFNDFNLRPQLVETVQQLGYLEPTPVQSEVIPRMLDGKDVLAQSKTGTGKTAAFALPMLNALDPKLDGIQGLVVAPTRELAVQVANAIYHYGKEIGVRVLAIYGGQSYSRQFRKLEQGVDIVVGTPGRLLDLIAKGKLDLQQVNTVILDEADEMLSMGFIEDIESILSNTPEKRQTALFSATLPPRIQQTARAYMHNAETVRIAHKELTVNAIEQRYYLVNAKDKLAALTRLFEVEPISRALIFTRTRLDTGELANELIRRGFPAEAINGDLSQDIRSKVLERFRQGQITVLVATDVAARGLDIDDISHVFNYDLPHELESYVHRIGRTGRAGKTGIAISLVAPGELFRIRKLESFTRQPITEAQVPTEEEILQKREEDLMSNMIVWLKRNRCKREQELVAGLAEEGYDMLEIAAVALKLARAEEKQRPIEPVSKVELRKPRRERRKSRYDRNDRPSRSGKRRQRDTREEGMVQVALSKGKAHGIRPGDVVGSIASCANIPGRVIGRISIQKDFTLVDIPEEHVAKVLAQKGNYEIRHQPVKISLAK